MVRFSRISPGKEPVSIEYEPGRAPEAVRAFLTRKDVSLLSGIHPRIVQYIPHSPKRLPNFRVYTDLH